MALSFDDLSRNEFDLFWSLFKVALLSYRASKILKPLPPLKDSPDDTLHQLKEFTKQIESFNQNKSRLTPELRDTFSSILSCQNCILREKDVAEDFQIIKDSFGADPPDFIFTADYSHSPGRIEQFQKVKEQVGSTFFAFHGSKLENFYSIVNNGLLVRGSVDEANLTFRRLINPGEKMPLYGEGIYLSSEMSVALTFSRRGHTWHTNCGLGSDILCVAVVEVADEKQVKKRQFITNTAGASSSFKDLLTNEIPPEYVLVTDPNSILIRYLLVFCERSPLPQHQQPGAAGESSMPANHRTGNVSIIRSLSRQFYQLVRTYPVATMVLSYCIILLFISHFNSRMKGPGFD